MSSLLCMRNYVSVIINQPISLSDSICVRVGRRMCLLVSQCVCASVDDTIVWLASGSSRVMQKLLVVLLIPLCQYHKKRHQSSETGGADHPPLLVSVLAQTSPDQYGGITMYSMMSVLKKTRDDAS